MFGKKKRDEEVGKAFGQQVIAMTNSLMDAYCDRVIYYMASGWLGSLASVLAELPDSEPGDDEMDRQRALLLFEFSEQTKQNLVVFEDQLAAELVETYNQIFDGENASQDMLPDLARKRLRTELEKIMEAAAYLAGISTARLRDLYPEKFAST